MKTLFFSICLIVIILLSGVRSGPVYGKLDFILLEPRPWWDDWKPMIQDLSGGKPVYTDALTSNVLNAVFNLPISTRYQWGFSGSNLDVKNLDSAKVAQTKQCMINLHGFTPSWVPEETRHWSSRSADTSIYYHYQGVKGETLKKYLIANPPTYCDVYF